MHAQGPSASLRAITGKGANIWLAAPRAPRKFVHLGPDQFQTLARLRLGLQIFSRTLDVVPFAATKRRTSLGSIAWLAWVGASIPINHSAMLQKFAQLATTALMRPTTECHCFPASPQSRMDIVIHTRALTERNLSTWPSSLSSRARASHRQGRHRPKRQRCTRQ